MTAATGRFGTPIAHGLLGLSVAMGLASRIGVFEECSVALLRVDDWVFHAPVRADDTLRCEIGILSTRLTGSGTTGVLERRFDLLDQHGELTQSGRIDLLAACGPS